MHRSGKLLDAAGRVAIVRRNSFTLMEQRSFVTALPFVLAANWIAVGSLGGRTSVRIQIGHMLKYEPHPV